MDNQVNYYAVIPANVRYDKDLPANAKLLYGEITALCNNKGFCWATNQYFADLYGVKKLAVSRWINALADKGYIFIVMEPKNDHTQELIRKISLPQIPTSKKIAGVIKKDVPPHQKRCTPTSKKICPHIKKDRGGKSASPTESKAEGQFFSPNNTYNNTVNNTSNISNTSGKPDKGDNITKDVIDYLNEKLGTKYKPNTSKTVSLVKARTNEGFTLDDFKTVIDKKVAAWFGDERMEKYLRPETLFGSKFESYLNEVEGHGQGFGKAAGKRQRKYDPEYERDKWAGETSGWK